MGTSVKKAVNPFITTFKTRTHNIIAKDKLSIAKPEKGKVQKNVYDKFAEFLYNAGDEADFKERKKAINICITGVQNAVNNRGYAETGEFGLKYVDLIMGIEEKDESNKDVAYKQLIIKSPELIEILAQLEVLAAHRNAPLGDKKLNFNFFAEACYTTHMENLKKQVSNINFSNTQSTIQFDNNTVYIGSVNPKKEPHGQGKIVVGAKDKIEYIGRFNDGKIIGGGKLKCLGITKFNEIIEIYTYHFREIFVKDFWQKLTSDEATIIKNRSDAYYNMNNVLQELIAKIKLIN